LFRLCVNCQLRDISCGGDPSYCARDRRFFEQISHFAKVPVILFPGKAQGRGAENLRVIGGGELSIIDSDQLIERQVGHAVHARHEERMDVKHKTVFRRVAVGPGIGALALLERGGVKDDLAGVSGAGAVFEDALQFVPANARSVFFKNLRAPGGHVLAQGLSGIVGCKFF
ncbi:MAG TPA: hypothetical protein VFB30_00005, partial [Spirochaetia bacterium]|nr:hypothetical protein [Spirochaetia bacterium]